MKLTNLSPRVFPKIIPFLAVLCVLSVTLSARADDTNFRQDTRLDSGWSFKLGDVSGAQNLDFNAATWQPVLLPHSWGWGQARAGKSYYRGPGWYRRELVVNPEPGRRYFLRFEAASLVADVYLNGKWLSEHRGGFGAFALDITTNLSAGGTNLLAVRVDNTRQPDIAPLSGDFNVYGGLYRPVHLIKTAAVHFTLTDHASPGVTWLQSNVTDTQAVLDVTAEISNPTTNGRHFALNPPALNPVSNPGSHASGGKFVLTAKVLAADGTVAAVTEQDIVLSPRMTEPFQLRVVVPNPHLWNGRLDPYLYRAVAELRSADGVVDAVEQPLGLRYYHVDPDQGFFLNGHKYPIYGVCRHQDRPEEGWAITEADMEQDVALIKELGATAVRCAHYQHSDYFYSLCDQAGILVWAEIPQVNQIRDTPEFVNTSRNQLLDLIRQNINHPSIFVWSLFNEVGGSGHTDDPHRELRDLAVLAHGEDPTRPTIGATSHDSWPQMNKIPDLLGWNRYPGWYTSSKEIEDAPDYWQEYKDTSQHGGFCISEYGAGANVTQHEENPKMPAAGGQWHPEEYQAELHEAIWKQVKSHPFIWGTFVWNMFDFCVAGRHEGGQIALNDKGLVTYNRKIKKDAFYFYQANWSPNPVLYITSRRFIDRTNAVTDVKIYSNANEVEMSVNGVSQGKHTNDGNMVFVWQNVQLSPGDNKVEAKAERDGRALADSCVWKLK